MSIMVRKPKHEPLPRSLHLTHHPVPRPHAHKHAQVVACDARPTTKQRPEPLNTVEFQKCASRYLHIDSTKALEVAEALYMRGILSYPRTETNFFSDAYDLRGFVDLQCEHAEWGGYARSLMQGGSGDGGGGGFLWPRDGGQNDQAHPPIHPTKAVAPGELSGDEKKVYEFVVRRFLACASHDARGEQTKVCVELPVGGEAFTATGLMITHKYWLEVYPWDRWTAKRVPLMRVGDSFEPTRLEMTEGRTAPPDLLSEVRTHVHTYTRTHIHAHTHAHTYTHTCTHTHMHAQTQCER